MLEKGFLKNQSDKKMNHHQLVLILSKTMLYLGTLILISVFGYLIFTFDKADSRIGMMLPFLVAGLGLIIVSQVIKRAYMKLRR